MPVAFALLASALSAVLFFSGTFTPKLFAVSLRVLALFRFSLLAAGGLVAGQW